MLKGIKHILTQ